MRVVSWNFLEGGWSKEGQELAPCAVRWHAAQHMVKRLSPDVLVLNEALYCAPYDGKFTDYGALFGFPYQVTQLYDGAWGNCILSRRPILDQMQGLIHAEGPQNRGWLAAQVQGPQGNTWISTYHPHPHRDPELRAGDVRRMLERLSDGPGVLCGDFNAIAPYDPIDRTKLLDSFERFSPPGQAKPAMDRFFKAGALLFDHVFPDFGWRDALLGKNASVSMPTALIRKGSDPGMRIDHMVVSQDILVQDAWIDRCADADVASDHYPVVLHMA